MQNLMLYYHIPFCLSKCAYCSFYSVPKADEELKAKYTEALIRQTAGFYDKDKHLVSSVYFGGGTPSVLGCDNLARVLNTVLQSFTLARDAEITAEVNPCTVDRQGLYLLKSAGFNRLSIGAQSFNDKTLKLLNRAHSAEDFVKCYETARDAGFTNISADLIFGLPNETAEDLTYSLERLIGLAPEHISVYNLSIEENTPLFFKKDSYIFPNEDEEEKQYELLCGVLAKAGYKHYEISNFAKAGYEAQHNSGYWEGVPYFGFGAGAHSFYQNRRFDTKRDITAFINSAYGTALAPTRFDEAVELTEEELEEERIMLGLRLSKGVKIKSPVPKYLIDTGLATYSNGTLALTEKGFRVSNAIIGMFI